MITSDMLSFKLCAFSAILHPWFEVTGVKGEKGNTSEEV